MERFLLSLALRLLPSKIFGVSTATIAAIAPEIVEAFSTVGRVIAALRANGQDEQSAARAAFELVAKKRDASPVESRVWGDRNTLPAN